MLPGEGFDETFDSIPITQTDFGRSVQNLLRWLLEAGSIDAVDLQRARHAASKLDKPDELLELIEAKWREERRGPLNLHNLSLLDRTGVPKGSDFEKIMLTAAAKQNCKNSGAFYFEVQLLSKIERINVGWATSAYQRSRDLGFDAESWCWQSQDGRTMFQLHAAEGPEAGCVRCRNVQTKCCQRAVSEAGKTARVVPSKSFVPPLP